MPVKAIASASPDEPGTARLSWEHPLAAVAARNCQKHSTILVDLVGGVACMPCWADAVLADLLLAIECDLPWDCESDPYLVDEIAVDRAVRQIVGADDQADAEELAFDALTEVERAEAKRRLAEIRNRRNRTYRFVCSRAAAARREATR
jgi:hypothetical protein